MKSHITLEFSLSNLNRDTSEPSSTELKLIPETVLFDGAGNLTSLIGFVEFLVKTLSTIKTTNAPLPSLMFWQPPCEKAGPLKPGYIAGH